MYIEIGRRIRRQRIKLGFTQERLAELAGISLSFLGHIERGTRKLSVDTLYKIAQGLQCSADELLGIDAPRDSSSLSEELSDIIIALQAIKRRFK